MLMSSMTKMRVTGGGRRLTPARPPYEVCQ
jgi:hypothetical protein